MSAGPKRIRQSAVQPFLLSLLGRPRVSFTDDGDEGLSLGIAQIASGQLSIGVKKSLVRPSGKFRD